MSEDAAALARVLLEAMGGFRVKRMFGGLGLFAGDVMFGLIDEGLIYLKTDPQLEADLRAAGARPWLYAERRGPRAGITVETSYLSLPDEAYDDPDEACRWAESGAGGGRSRSRGPEAARAVGRRSAGS